MRRWRLWKQLSRFPMSRESLTMQERESYTSKCSFGEVRKRERHQNWPLADTASTHRYYQPSTAINSDNCFPSRSASPPSAEDVQPVKDVTITSNAASSKISSPDTALTAFCQLVCHRMGAERAMIRCALYKLQKMLVC
jgi:hypothetical protein